MGHVNVHVAEGRLSRRALLHRAARTLTTVSVAGLCLPACGTGGSSKKSPQLILWYEVAAPFSLALPDLVKAYNSTAPAVRVQDQEQVQLGLKLPVVIGAHDAPDLVIYARSQAWPLAKASGTFNVTDYAKRDEIGGSLFNSVAWSGAQHQDKLWGLPLTIDTTLLLYNKKLFTAAGLDPGHAPSTWDELNAASKTLSTFKGGLLTQAGFFAHRDVPFSEWLWMLGADLLTPDGKAPAFDNAAGLQVMRYILDDVNANGGAQALGNFQFANAFSDGEPGLFTKERLCMFASTYGTVFQMSKSAMGPNLAVGLLPHPSNGKVASRADGFYVFSPVNTPDPHPDGAWQFMKWLSTNAEAQKGLSGSYVVPALLSVQTDPAVANKPGVATLIEAMRSARFDQDFAGAQEVEAGLDLNVQDMVAGKMTPEQALKDGADRAVKVLHTYTG
jgi:multiple sugar transport system substrate-binding protein